MSELQNRRYKEISPEKTVQNLKSILDKMNIEVDEEWKNSSLDTYSLRVCVKGTNIGQNGKGMTKEFAMASGYAEFFERLQNNLLRFRTEKPTKELPFSSSPDEKYLSIEELMNSYNSILDNIVEVNGYGEKPKEEQIKYIKNIFGSKLKNSEDKYLSIPYYSIRHKDIEYIPEDLFSHLFGSNGMCAGNSPEEALIEGISEIFERYVATKIFKEKQALPQIPDEYIATFPKVKKMVEKLKENDDYYFKLIDCSLGGKYPVAALYIINKNTGKFGFKLGAHPDYGVAMERCFTEATQGRDIYDYSQVCIFDFYEYNENEEKNYTKFLLSEFKNVPYQILGEEPAYKFTKMPDVSNLDNKTILRNLINQILKEKKDVLIRDVSILGFPTFSIAIPQMSEYSFDHNGIYFGIVKTMQYILRDLKNINLSNISQIIEMMETIVNKIGYEKLSLFISLKDISILPCEQMNMGGKYFLAIAYIMNREYGKAAKLLEDLSFLADNLVESPLEKIMIKAVYYYASAMDKLKEHTKAMYYIELLFDEQIANAIDISFKDRNNIFVNHYGITEEDYVENDDSYYLPFMKKFREAQKKNIINQAENIEMLKMLA